ncbi:MAG: transposase [Bacteroidota bacterium]
MLCYPPEFLGVISVFSESFSKKVFSCGCLLILGAILTHGNRTVCGVLRSLGLHDIKNWDLYHRILSRASWSPRRCSASLLGLLLSRFVQGSRVVLAIDETLERRWGPKIEAKAHYYDSIRSSREVTQFFDYKRIED